MLTRFLGSRLFQEEAPRQCQAGRGHPAQGAANPPAPRLPERLWPHPEQRLWPDPCLLSGIRSQEGFPVPPNWDSSLGLAAELQKDRPGFPRGPSPPREPRARGILPSE